MKHHILLFFLFIFSFSFAGTAQEGEVQAFELIFEEKNRSYLLYLPQNIKDQAPLVFVLHGYGGSAEDMVSFSGMNKVADIHNFAVCYPQGNFGPDQKNSWNAGYSNDDVDDVKFLSELAGDLQQKYKLSANNTFCTGMSNGADMCYVLACRCPHIFAAIAPVAGCMMESTYNLCDPLEAIPVFETHGTDDDITLWTGDAAYSEKYGGYFGVQKVMALWKEKNNCSEVSRSILPDTNKKDSSYVLAEKYSNKEKQVWLYTLVGGKHDWPGSWGNMDICMAEEIWSFFQQFVRE